MKIKKILLTGDDGYKAPGIRLLIAALRDKYDLTIAATYDQQSAVGGLLSLSKGFDWGIDQVDGIKAFWVKGSPADAMSLIGRYYDENSFDLVVSGVNWGANLGAATFASGTINAALRGIGLSIAPHAIAMSWDLPPKYYLNNHKGDEKLVEFLDYPGKAIDQVLDLAIENKLWGSKLININFPKKNSRKVLFTKPILQIKKVYSNSLEANEKLRQTKGGNFSYFDHNPKRNNSVMENLSYDVAAINQGYISIMPCSDSLLDEKVFAGLEGKELKLN